MVSAIFTTAWQRVRSICTKPHPLTAVPSHKPVTSEPGAVRGELPENASFCAATRTRLGGKQEQHQNEPQNRRADDHGGSIRSIAPLMHGLQGNPQRTIALSAMKGGT